MYERLRDLFKTFKSSYLVITSALVFMANFCPCFESVLSFIFMAYFLYCTLFKYCSLRRKLEKENLKLYSKHHA